MQRRSRLGRRLVALALTGMLGASVFALPVSATTEKYHGVEIEQGSYGGKDALESGTPKQNAEKIWKKLMSLGFSEKAAAGIMGNFMMECSLDPTSESADACGLAQWTGGNKKKIQDWAKRKNKDWKEIDVQLDFLWDDNTALTYQGANESTSGNCHNIHISAVEICKGIKDAKSIKDVHSFAKADFATPSQAAEVWTWFHEVPRVCTSHVVERMKYAEDIYEKFKGVKGDSNSKSADTVDASVIETGGYLPEDNYVSLDKLTEDGIALPTKAELSATQGGKYDLKVLDEWKEDIAYRNKKDTHSGIRTAVALLGILLTLYSVLVYIAYQFDTINNIIDISLLSIITFGRLRISPEFDKSTFMNNQEGGAKGTSKTGQKTVVHKDILIICTIGITIGVLIFSGKLYMMISWVIAWVKGVIFK